MCVVAGATLAGGLIASSPCRAEARLAPIFGDHMVLQRNVRVPLWGEAPPGERVEVRLPRQRKAAVADAKGHWKILLEPLQADDPFEVTVQGAGTPQVLRDVLVGEVWLCSGQSNMQMEVRYASDPAKVLAEAADSQLRLFTVGRAQKPDSVFRGEWTNATSVTVADFSAVAYHFGQRLRRELGVPVGLINSTLGGSTAQSWTPRDALAADPAFAPGLAENWAPWVAAHLDHDAKMEVWLKDYKTAQTEGKPTPARPVWPPVPFLWNQPGFLFEKMIAPIMPYAMQGVIWYQGEANAPRAAQYRTLFPILIRGWREKAGQPGLAFLWVQLPNFKAVQSQPSQSEWAELREAQAMTLSMPHTGMATAIDIGEANDIHPKNKAEVGRRLALIALNSVYKHAVESSGPFFDSIRVVGDKVVVQWKHTTGLKTNDGRAPQAFALCGTDGIWHWAEATIDGETCVLRSPRVPQPVSVRYAWADNPVVNLVNAAGLPAAPFRTDNARDITMKNTALPADKA